MKKNILANVIGRLWGILSNFLFIPLYIKYLGFESFSIISFTLVIAGLMAVLDAGLSATLSREFSRSDTTLVENFRIFKTLETTYFIIIGLVVAIVFFLSKTIALHGVNLKHFSVDKVSYYIKIISFDIGFQLILRFYIGGLLGLEKQVKANLYQIFWGILRNGFVVLAIIYLPTLEIFFIWQSVSTVLFAFIFRILLYKELVNKYQIKFNFIIEKGVLKNIWQFAGGMLLISLVAALNTQLDKIVISKLLPVESLGYYTLATSLAIGIMVVVNPISIALLPRFTALYSAGDNFKVAALFKIINLIVAILVFSLMSNMSFFAQDLIWIWTGKIELAEKAHFILPITSFTYAMLALATIPYNVAIANGYTKLNNILGILSLVITLPGYWFATKNYGAFGAATIYCGVQTLITLVYIYFINKKFIRLPLITVFLKQMALPFLVSVLVSFCFSFMPEIFSTNRVLALIWIGFSTVSTLLITGMLLLYKDRTTLRKFNQ